LREKTLAVRIISGHLGNGRWRPNARGPECLMGRALMIGPQKISLSPHLQPDLPDPAKALNKHFGTRNLPPRQKDDRLPLFKLRVLIGRSQGDLCKNMGRRGRFVERDWDFI